MSGSLSTTNPIWTDTGANPGLQSKSSATNHLSYSTRGPVYIPPVSVSVALVGYLFQTWVQVKLICSPVAVKFDTSMLPVNTSTAHDNPPPPAALSLKTSGQHKEYTAGVLQMTSLYSIWQHCTVVIQFDTVLWTAKASLNDVTGLLLFPSTFRGREIWRPFTKTEEFTHWARTSCSHQKWNTAVPRTKHLFLEVIHLSLLWWGSVREGGET
jgi:hypothetical protein